jgi:hypothetical protein
MKGDNRSIGILKSNVRPPIVVGPEPLIEYARVKLEPGAPPVTSKVIVPPSYTGAMSRVWADAAKDVATKSGIERRKVFMSRY